MKRYEVATLTVLVGTIAKALPLIKDYVTHASAGGRLLGCWTAEIGALNRIRVLRGFADEPDLMRERERALQGGNAFGIADFVTAMTLDAYAPFPFLPPIACGNFGPVYEFREYDIKPQGLASVIEIWRGATGARIALSPLVIAMHAVEGATPRFMHIWPYRSLDERQRIRAAAISAGVWPPKGGADHLTTMQTSIFLPVDFSPLS